MGTEPRRMTEAESHPDRQISRLEAEIETTRANLGAAIAELDRRRHAVLDWKRQLRRHGLLVAAIAALLVGLGAGARVLARRRSARRRRVSTKLGRFARAVGRMAEHPGRVASRNPTPLRRIAAGVATAAATAAARRWVSRSIAARKRRD